VIIKSYWKGRNYVKIFILLFTLATTVASAASAIKSVSCLTPAPSGAAVVRMLEQAKTSSHAVMQPGVIGIVRPDIRRSDGMGALGDATLQSQIAALNDAMRANGMPITFRFTSCQVRTLTMHGSLRA